MSNDITCPRPNCPDPNYELNDDNGDLVCYESRFTVSNPNNCVAIGECVSPDIFMCEQEEAQELSRTNSTCQVIEGCTGNELPMIVNSADGELCNIWGTCQNGQCTTPDFCAQFDAYNNLNLFCSSSVENMNQLCEFYVDGTGINGNGRITCNDFCEQVGQGASCVEGWNNQNENSCQRGDRDGCDENYRTQICLCQVP